MTPPAKKYLIGRDRNCDIALAHATVSSRHAELSFLGDGKLLLTDCQSCNGTFRLLPDGRALPVRQELVSPLDRVRFGEVALDMRDLLEAIRLKHADILAPPPAPPPPPDPLPPAQGRALERCDCGCVKAVGQSCPGCGR